MFLVFLITIFTPLSFTVSRQIERVLMTMTVTTVAIKVFRLFP